jgi:hypothetical protein
MEQIREQDLSTGRVKKPILVQIKASPKECTSLTEFAKFEDASRLDLTVLISISHSLPSRIPLILDIQDGLSAYSKEPATIFPSVLLISLLASGFLTTTEETTFQRIQSCRRKLR